MVEEGFGTYGQLLDCSFVYPSKVGPLARPRNGQNKQSSCDTTGYCYFARCERLLALPQLEHPAQIRGHKSGKAGQVPRAAQIQQEPKVNGVQQQDHDPVVVPATSSRSSSRARKSLPLCPFVLTVGAAGQCPESGSAGGRCSPAGRRRSSAGRAGNRTSARARCHRQNPQRSIASHTCWLRLRSARRREAIARHGRPMTRSRCAFSACAPPCPRHSVPRARQARRAGRLCVRRDVSSATMSASL